MMNYVEYALCAGISLVGLYLLRQVARSLRHGRFTYGNMLVERRQWYLYWPGMMVYLGVSLLLLVTGGILIYVKAARGVQLL